MSFSKQDLLEQHYSWEVNTQKTLFTGIPTRREFNRFNGDQVLFLINYYGSLSEQFTIEQARKLEQLIANQLPLEARSEITVFNWLREYC